MHNRCATELRLKHSRQSIRDHSLVLARMQTSIEQLKDRMLSGDPDLAMRISKATVFAATEDIGSRPFASRTDSDSSVASSSMPASSPTSPLSPTRELHSAFDAERRQRGWRASFRSKQARADDLMQRVTNRPESVKTSSSTSSAATMMSSSSTSSKASLATVDNISVYRLPISAEDVSNGHHYIGVALEPTVSPPVVLDDTALLKKVVEAEDEDEAAETVSALPPSAQHRKVLPIMSRPSSRAESRMDSKQTLVTSRASKAAPAEIEMSARKYQGYWRASFDAALPAVAAICGCVLLTTGAGTSGPQKYTRTDDVVDCAEAYAEALAQAPSPAQLLRAVQAGDAEDLVFALKASLDASPPPVVPAKIAFSMYKELAEAKDKQKMTKAWDKISKLLKKVPQEALVPLMFFATIGRKLRQRGMIVEGKPAGVYLMQNLWPQLGSKSLFANDTAAGDAVSHLLITQYDDIPDELPVMLQAVNYKFESGSKVNLMTLLTTKRVRQGMHGREGSSGTSAS